MSRAGSVLACLAFAVPFGGVGVFATWAIGATVWDALRAKDWVQVEAKVESAALHESESDEGGSTYRAEGLYRYAFAGRTYESSRLGISRVGGSDNLDDWHESVNARLEEARAEGRSIRVWVNPLDPAESVYDRELRWMELVFLVPFSVAFGGVGVGALVAMFFVLRGTATRRPGGRAGPERRASTPDRRGGGQNSGAGFLWAFALLWNAIAWPIALLVMPDVLRDGEWVGLFVLIFPALGVLLLWGAAAAGWKAYKKGRRAEVAASSVPRTPAATMAEQARRAMFDPPREAPPRPATRISGARDSQVPRSTADLVERDGVLTLRFSARRRLAAAILLFFVGAVLTVAGVALFFADGAFVGAIVALAAGSALDLAGVALFVGELVVTARPGELAVERRGLLGRRAWRVRGESIRSVDSALSYKLNGRPYYSLHAETNEGRIPLGNSIEGAQLADSLAERIGRTLGLPASVASRAALPEAGTGME